MAGVRDARPADAASIAGLLEDLGYPQDGVDSVAERVRRWLDDPASALFVWADDGDVAGVIAVHVCPYFERDGAWARITALVVARRVRGRGAGAALVGAAEAFARERGCPRVEVTSSRHRTGAHAFYQRLGYVDQCATAGRFLRSMD